MPSSKFRSRGSPPRELTTTGCTFNGTTKSLPATEYTFHGPDSFSRVSSGCRSAWALAASVKTITYFTPSVCRYGTPTAASLSV